jgi:hypothetical protein
METFKGRAHVPGVDQEWLFVLEMNWEGKEVNLHVEGAPGHITSWQGLQVQTFGTYEIAFKTKGIPPLLTHWWHLVRPDNDNLIGLIVGLPDKHGTWTTCPINLTKVKS